MRRKATVRESARCVVRNHGQARGATIHHSRVKAWAVRGRVTSAQDASRTACGSVGWQHRMACGERREEGTVVVRRRACGPDQAVVSSSVRSARRNQNNASMQRRQ